MNSVFVVTKNVLTPDGSGYEERLLGLYSSATLARAKVLELFSSSACSYDIDTFIEAFEARLDEEDFGRLYDDQGNPVGQYMTANCQTKEIIDRLD